MNAADPPPFPRQTPRDFRYYSTAGRALRSLLARRGSTIVSLDRDGRKDLALVRRTRELVPLLMPDAPALHILACVRAAARRGGAMAEAGVFMGGSARLICEAKGAAPLHLFDVFETLQRQPGAPASDSETAVKEHFGNVYATLDPVRKLLSGYGEVHFHPGLFPASAADLGDTRFGFVHLDMDLARSTRDALDFFHPRLLPGGILIGDDYNLADVRGAFEAFFARTGDTLIALPWAQVMVVKRAD